MNNTDRTKKAPLKKESDTLQVNAELQDEVARAFARCRRAIGVKNNAPLAHIFIVEGLRSRGYLSQVEHVVEAVAA